MEDNIIIRKLWNDVDFFNVRIECFTQVICVYTEAYITNDSVDELDKIIFDFLHNNCQNIEWKNQPRGELYSACVALNFRSIDKFGHVLIEVYLELNDESEYGRHNCCFYINTECGLLETFRKKLCHLKCNDNVDIQLYV